MTLGNILSKTRNSPSMHANFLVALLPVSPKFIGNKQNDDALKKCGYQIL
jgi:hypothetical protein